LLNLKTIFVLTALLACTESTLATDLKPYEAVYQTQAKGFNVNIEQGLQLRGSQWMLSNDAKRLSFGVSESSEFTDPGHGSLLPVRYKHIRKGQGDSKNSELVFDWKNKTVHDALKSGQAPFSIGQHTLDKLSVQTQMRIDLMREPDRKVLEYTVTDGKKFIYYRFDWLGEEILKTALGEVHCLKFKRTRRGNVRQVDFWVAPQWGYLVVQSDQFKEPGAKAERMSIKKLKYNNINILKK